MYRYFKSAILSMLLVGVVHAGGIEAYHFDDAEKEASYKNLIAELRCLVCQNQNLAESNAELALDLRRQTYEMVSEGKSEKQVVDYMVQRYGDFVLYRPPVQFNTLLLWLGPFVFLLIAVVVLLRIIRTRSRQTETVFSTTDQQKAEQLLGEKENKK